MGGIYIPNFNMPECCAKCRFFEEFNGVGLFAPFGHCGIDGKELYVVARKNPECPLIPVPDHGRLIDADKLEENLRLCAKYQDGYRQQGILGCCETIRMTNAIIPASK